VLYHSTFLQRVGARHSHLAPRVLTLQHAIALFQGSTQLHENYVLGQSKVDGFDSLEMDRLLLRFTSKEAERQYKESLLHESIIHIRLSLVFGVFLVLVFGLIDSGVLLRHQSVVQAWEIRYGVILPTAFAMLVLTCWSRFIDYSQQISGAGFYIIGTAWSAFCFRTEQVAILYASLALIQTYVFAFFCIGLLFRFTLILSCIVTLIFSTIVLTQLVDPSLAVLTQATLMTFFVLLAMAAYQRELASRKLYIAELRQRHSALRQAKDDQRYLEWLRLLARFLRHEVRQPVAQINSSIELLQMKMETNDQLNQYLVSASQGALQIWNLVERASRATDAEAFVRKSTAQLTNVTKAISSLVQIFSETHSGVRFDFEAQISLAMKVDPLLIKEAVTNLLSNAASYAIYGSVVETKLMVDDGFAIITVSNKGDPIANESDSLFHPFTSTRTGLGSEHQGIGLYLVRLIADHYGGGATIRNLSDGSGVEACISLSLSEG
jgi:signal transduction histidine kinase